MGYRTPERYPCRCVAACVATRVLRIRRSSNLHCQWACMTHRRYLRHYDWAALTLTLTLTLNNSNDNPPNHHRHRWRGWTAL